MTSAFPTLGVREGRGCGEEGGEDFRERPGDFWERRLSEFNTGREGATACGVPTGRDRFGLFSEFRETNLGVRNPVCVCGVDIIDVNV
jgi:hypothetical protein